jgi:ribosomal protein S16
MKPSSGRFIEKLGYYNPNLDSWSQKSVYLDLNRFFFWVKKGVKIDKSLYLLIKPLLLSRLRNI